MTTSHWRVASNKAIRGVIAEIGTEDTKALRKALKEAYPFGERKYHPYKIWCSEVQHMVPGLYPTRKAPEPELAPRLPFPGPRYRWRTKTT